MVDSWRGCGGTLRNEINRKRTLQRQSSSSILRPTTTTATNESRRFKLLVYFPVPYITCLKNSMFPSAVPTRQFISLSWFCLGRRRRRVGGKEWCGGGVQSKSKLGREITWNVRNKVLPCVISSVDLIICIPTIPQQR